MNVHAHLTPRRRLPASTNAHRAILVACMIASPASAPWTAPVVALAAFLKTTHGLRVDFEALHPWAARVETALFALPDDDLFPVTLAVARELLDGASDEFLPLDRALCEAQYAALRCGWSITPDHDATARALLDAAQASTGARP